jgi:hypothetical protein
MQALRDFWQRGWVGKVVLIATGFCGAMMLCCVVLIAVNAIVPSKPQSVATCLLQLARQSPPSRRNQLRRQSLPALCPLR